MDGAQGEKRRSGSGHGAGGFGKSPFGGPSGLASAGLTVTEIRREVRPDALAPDRDGRVLSARQGALTLVGLQATRLTKTKLSSQAEKTAELFPHTISLFMDARELRLLASCALVRSSAHMPAFGAGVFDHESL